LGALEWLERLPPPFIACPHGRAGQRVETFVPNNDADSLGGDLGLLPEIRTKKTILPMLLEGTPRFLYVWPIVADGPADHVVAIAERLYQFGRGVDMAWAVAQVCESDDVERRLREHVGTVHRPGTGEGHALACPTAGSLASLVARHQASARRLRSPEEGGQRGQLFAQPPKPLFAQVGYDVPQGRLHYELRSARDGAAMHPWPMRRIVQLGELLRDTVTAKLQAALPKRREEVRRVLVGRQPDGSNGGPTDRIRIVPLPSIGHEHADLAVRRVLVEVPPSSPISQEDIHWAFSGLEPHDPSTGEIDFVVTATLDTRMAEHFVRSSRRWRTVTPAVLPESAKRRRIEPARRREEAKGAAERGAEERSGVAAVHAALRHAGIDARPVRISVQREPFDTKGARAESFANATRFPKERFWHVQIEFAQKIGGPIALGDGRFLGLGLLAPVSRQDGAFAFDVVDGLVRSADPIAVSRALRRAVMARVQAKWGRGTLPLFFTGHEDSGEPARRSVASHVAFQLAGEQLLILAPHLLDDRPPERWELDHLAVLEEALADLTELNAGRSGRLSLERDDLATDSRLLGVAQVWRSVTTYSVNRHSKLGDAKLALVNDVADACVRRGLARPEVTVTAVAGRSGRGLEGRLNLRFPAAVKGPLLLGRTRYLGGGLFEAMDER